MKTERVWRGQHGSVVLGPTEDRVARYLHDLTRHGLVTVRTTDLAHRLDLERSEAYRVLARMRVLGLFGIENDRSGKRGGRRIWRTAGARASSGLDAGRHRVAWARVVAWTQRRRARVIAAIHTRRSADAHPAVPATPPGSVSPSGPGGGTVADALRRHGLDPGLLHAWGLS